MAKMMTFEQFQATDDFGSYGLNGEWLIQHFDGVYQIMEDGHFDCQRFISLEHAEICLYAMYANEYALTEGY